MILKQLAIISEPEVSFERLHSLIIGLAIRGRIVPQESADGDASELLERDSQIEAPFDVPANWAWCTLGNIADSLRYGYTAKADDSIAGVKFLRITDIQNNQVNWSTVPGCIVDEGKSLNKIQLQKNDIVVARTGGTVGKSFILHNVPSTPAVFASYLIRVRLREPRITRFLKKVLESDFYWSQLSQKTSGTGQPNVNAKALSQLLIPLPPLPEQKRIVARVEELTDLCNRLEKAHQTRNKLRDDFTASALDNLTQAKTPDQLKPAWTIIKNNFPTITATPESIQKLRQTILQLAVQGKLILNGSQSDFDDLPKDWAWSSLPELSWAEGYGTSSKCSYDWQGIPVLRIPNVASGFIDVSDLKHSSPELQIEESEKLQPNDFLIVRTNGSVSLIGRAAVVKDVGVGSFFASYIIRYRLKPSKIAPDYLSYCWSSPSVRSQLESLASTTAGQYNLSLKKLKTVKIPLPPMSEQE